jgi:glycine dehydrogenase subunit 1
LWCIYSEDNGLSKPHSYLPNSVPEIKEEMMDAIGIKSIDELYAVIPEELRFDRDLEIPGPYSEVELKNRVSETLEKNMTLNAPPFLGGGVWPHYVPSIVDEVVRRAELLTSYTPYQPEISQGILQAIFEYQSLVCELVGMAVSNASLYDWGSACGEAARMASRLTRRDKIIVPHLISPERLSVMRTYTEPAGMRMVQVDYDKSTGQMDLEDLKDNLDDDTAAVYVENPSYLGFAEEQVDGIDEIVHDNDSLFIVGVDPMSLGIMRPPGDYGADIVIGEGQPLGNHMNYGGPLLGILACKHDNRMIRQIPGRIIGLTEEEESDRTGYVMTLATREQHIRRERATSNICSNQALNCIAAGVYLALMGPNGMKELGEVITGRAHYALRRIGELPGVRAPIFNSFHFKEFTVEFKDTTVEEVERELRAHRLQGGISLKSAFPEFGETSLFCVTEVHTKGHIDKLVQALKGVLEG